MIDRLKNALCSISNDKVLHFVLSMVIAQVSFCVFGIFTPVWLASVLGIICVCAVGAAKELYDKKHGGVASWKDFAADAIGGAVGIVISLLTCFSVS